MQVEVRIRGVERAGVVREHIEDLAQRQLHRLAHEVERISVWVVDENGPKGGVDKRCSIVVRRAHGPSLAASERGLEVLAVVDATLDRVKACLRRETRRALSRRRASPALRGS